MRLRELISNLWLATSLIRLLILYKIMNESPFIKRSELNLNLFTYKCEGLRTFFQTDIEEKTVLTCYAKTNNRTLKKMRYGTIPQKEI